MKGKVFILMFFALLVLTAHTVKATSSENEKTAYTAVQVYGFTTTGAEKIATVVAANYLHALTLTVTISSPRMLTYIDPYYTTLQPGETTVFYSPSNGRYYVNAIESDGTVIFFTDHEIYWNWDKRNNTVTMTVEKTLTIDSEMVIIGKYNSWGTPVTLSITYSYAPTLKSASSSGTVVYFSTNIIDSTVSVFVVSASISPTLMIFQPAPFLIAPNAVVKSISVSDGTAVFAVSFFGWGAPKPMHMTFTSIGWSASKVTYGPVTFILTSKAGEYALVTFWPTGFMVDSTSYNLIYSTSFGFIREGQPTLTARGYVLGKYTTFVLSNDFERVATYNNSLLIVVVSGETVYSGKPYNHVSSGTLYIVTSSWLFNVRTIPVTFYVYGNLTTLIVSGTSFVVNENNVLVSLIPPKTITVTDKCGAAWPTYITVYYSIVHGRYNEKTYNFFDLTIWKRYTHYYETKIHAPDSYRILGYYYSVFEAHDYNGLYLAVIITLYITPKRTDYKWGIVQSGLATIDPIKYYVLCKISMLPRVSTFIHKNSLWINTYAVKNQERLQECMGKSMLLKLTIISTIVTAIYIILMFLNIVNEPVIVYNLILLDILLILILLL